MSGEVLTAHYRCPEDVGYLPLTGALSADAGFFRFGGDSICYGASVSGCGTGSAEGDLYDAIADMHVDDRTLLLPFDLSQVIENLRQERYFCSPSLARKVKGTGKFVRDVYYWLRPLLPVQVRKHLQRLHLRGWKDIPFPRWPVDRTVEQLFEKVLELVLHTRGIERLPFIWFWPDGYQACAIMTHDVETAAGRDFCGSLMDINDACGLKSSFQIVPEERYEVPGSFLNDIRDRGFEINLHGLNHDGHLFDNRDEFLRRARAINNYAKHYGAVGFRSPVMYRNLDWYDAFDFSYDMSVPNVAHLDPQRGGCCTVMPYFVGHIVELPLTTTQDYTLFNIFNERTIDLWKRQMDLIMEKHGLMSFLVHPDYVIDQDCRYIYRMLLEYLVQRCKQDRVWTPLPREVDRWWRQRSQMTLIEKDGHWQIEGEGKEKARLAYATLDDGRILYQIEGVPGPFREFME
jgi:hypothetical protein